LDFEDHFGAFESGLGRAKTKLAQDHIMALAVQPTIGAIRTAVAK
jgi:hypothetical protein